MSNFNKESINALIRKGKSKANDNINNDVQPFLLFLIENQSFCDVYKKECDSEPILGLDCRFVISCRLIKALYVKRFCGDDQYKKRKSSIWNYIDKAFRKGSQFLEKSSRNRIDLLSSLHLYCDFFGTSGENIAYFYEKYTFFMNAVNNSRMCAWYARNLEEVVELYCIYNHLTSVDYEYILNDYEIDYKGVKVNGLSNFKEMCLKESNSTKKLTATKDLEISILNGLSENDIDGFIEFMVGKIVSNPYNFSQIRYKTIIINAFKIIDEDIKVEDDRFLKQSCFSIFEWQNIINKTGIIPFELNSDYYYKFLYCCTKGIAQKQYETQTRDHTDFVDIYYRCRNAEKNFTYETELLILRSLIIIKHYNEDEIEHFVENANKDLRKLNLFQINSDTRKLIKGFGIDYAVTNNL